MKFIIITIQIFATYILMLSFMTFGFFQNKKIAEIFIKYESIEEITTQFRIANLNGIDLNNFALTNHFLGLAAIIVGIILSSIILRKLKIEWTFVLLITIPSLIILYNKVLIKPANWLSENLIFDISLKIIFNGLLFLLLSITLFWCSLKIGKFKKI